MDDYIKRSDAIKTVCGDCEYYSTNDCEDCRLDRLTKIPAADVRPVVLCRDCKYFTMSRNGVNGCCSKHCDIGGASYEYCSDGERREGSAGNEHGTYGSDIADGQWVSCPNCGALMEDSNV